jgi:hypothetical protein
MKPSMTRRAIWVTLLAAVLISTGSPASARHTPLTRTDPRQDAFVDVWRTSKVTVHETGYRLVFRVTGNLGPDWSPHVSSMRVGDGAPSTSRGTSRI